MATTGEEYSAKVLMSKLSKPEKMTDEAWKGLWDMVTSTIQLYLADNILREVSRLMDLAEIWAKLENMYKSKSLINQLYLKKQLYDLKLDQVIDLAVHLVEFNRILMELLTFNVQIEEEDKAVLLLALLPVSHDHIVTTLIFENDTLKHDEVIVALLMNECRQKSCSDGLFGEGGSLALSTRGRG